MLRGGSSLRPPRVWGRKGALYPLCIFRLPRWGCGQNLGLSFEREMMSACIRENSG